MCVCVLVENVKLVNGKIPVDKSVVVVQSQSGTHYVPGNHFTLKRSFIQSARKYGEACHIKHRHTDIFSCFNFNIQSNEMTC